MEKPERTNSDETSPLKRHFLFFKNRENSSITIPDSSKNRIRFVFQSIILAQKRVLQRDFALFRKRKKSAFSILKKEFRF
ncbi:hypothetical protein DLM77_18825 [Leptospira yasudae]|uniref:Uncharacterized protein n=1 Tax=Leptospira yasudae TaxID=2202201 RepID=A0ABX9M0J7_9LEPT|nr:hypothetical protein DLM77_18825 [Leptospira yasudae]